MKADRQATPDELATFRKWQKGLRINHMAHHRAAARYAMLGRALGVAVVVVSTIVGTAIFTTLKESPSVALKTGAGLLSVVAAVLAALQTFLGFAQRQAAHHDSAVRYGALRRERESVLGMPPSKRDLRQLLADVRMRWDEVDANAPAVPQRLWKDAVESVDEAEAAARASR